MNISANFCRHPFHKDLLFPYNTESQQVNLLCLYQDIEQSELEKIKKELNLSSLSSSITWGRVLISCAPSDVIHVYQIVAALMKKNFKVFLNDGSQVTFKKTNTPRTLASVMDKNNLSSSLSPNPAVKSSEYIYDDNPSPKSSSNSPHLVYDYHVDILVQQKIMLDGFKKLVSLGLDDSVRSPYYLPSFWLISEGKIFAEEFMKTHHLKSENNMELDLSLTPLPSPPSIPPIPISDNNNNNNNKTDKIPAVVAHDEEESSVPVRCVMCEEKSPSTVVLPCLHCVVCEDCSKKLSHDLYNKNKCIYCRQEIEQIIHDVNVESKN